MTEIDYYGEVLTKIVVDYWNEWRSLDSDATLDERRKAVQHLGAALCAVENHERKKS